MDNAIPFSCPNCGNQTLKAGAEVKAYSDLLGCSCTMCGHVITDDDIESQARKIADDIVRACFKNSA